MKIRSRAIAKKTAAIIVIIAVLIGASGYTIWAYEYGQPPFCSGYPPGGDCPGNISYTFRILINYTGSWQATYYGYHSVGAPSNPYAGAGNYTGGSLGGTGSFEKNITLSGPNTDGLTICVQAGKLDSSDSLMTLSIDASSNDTSLPNGHATLCLSVVP
jgi:hypothetical protein